MICESKERNDWGEEEKDVSKESSCETQAYGWVRKNWFKPRETSSYLGLFLSCWEKGAHKKNQTDQAL